MTHRIWMVGARSLTAAQRRIVTLPVSQNHLILGPAGSGKTVLLLHRANHLLNNEQVASHRLRVLVFTNVLESYIRSGSESLGLPESIVQSFYSWVFELARIRRIRFSREGSLANQCRDAMAAVLEYFENNHVSPALDAALVDEGQDLPPEAYRLLAQASSHVTVCADYDQCLYEHSIEPSEALDVLGIADGPVWLPNNLRSLLPVTRLAACFGPQIEMEQRSQSDDDPSVTERIPLLLRCSSYTAQWRRLGAIARQEMGRNTRIGVLVPGNNLVDEAYFHLAKEGVPAQKVVAKSGAQADFDELTPKVLTIFSGKGLSFDTVLIPSVTDEEYRRRAISPEKLLFVGCTRALEWVCLSTLAGHEPGALTKAHELAATGQLIEQEVNDGESSHIRPEPIAEEELPL
jgi:hypothetical protein